MSYSNIVTSHGIIVLSVGSAPRPHKRVVTMYTLYTLLPDQKSPPRPVMHPHPPPAPSPITHHSPSPVTSLKTQSP